MPQFRMVCSRAQNAPLEDSPSMSKTSKLLLIMLVVSLAILGCGKEQEENEEDAFSFVVFPGARYLPHLTELTKQAHKVISPGAPEAPPTAIYDTDATVDDVANFYVKAYGYTSIAPDATNNLSSAKPAAYRRTGDIGADVKGIESLMTKMNLHPDLAKATGSYKAVEIAPKPNRPRVTIQRPYFDLTTSQVVDRTIILMAR
jgi:hypothetical protein